LNGLRLDRFSLLAMVCLAHALLIAFLLASSRFETQHLSRERRLGADLIFLQLNHPTLPSHQSNSTMREPAAPAHRSALAISPSVPPSASPSSMLSGPIDWAEEAKRVARDHVQRQARAVEYRSFSAHERGVRLTDQDATQRRDESQSFQGGEVITWINDRCFVTNRGWTPFDINPQSQVLCKDPPRRD
jgi:hypothetical protein